ncbi:AAA family ATPase [Jeotgalibacillus proteolyticus]|uniref:DNA topology modulation protein FlaR n=1 Tax=Jeotgalibacillus proteolyticus TaxID=2082395 RepID=A0A2S5GBI1_9BACL|nr:AAA family ATPase [Jeotgalibacillus proteolyticus]PPA70356.1 DNA topology modulation protein FlaR [Jeotgalibacillus proteolyticus]
MINKIPQKIHIIGSVGSGKTTLAKKLSSRLSIPFYELDNVVWERDSVNGDRRRAEKEREEYLTDLTNKESWIIEGVHNEEWVGESLRKAELIIYLDTRYSVRTFRIIKRFLLQRLKIEKANYKPTVEIFLKMFKWNRYFEEVGKPNFFTAFGQYAEKILIVKNGEAAEKRLKGKAL